MATMTIEEIQDGINSVLNDLTRIQQEMTEAQHLLEHFWWVLTDYEKQEA